MPNGTGSRCVRPTLQGRYGHTPMTWDLRFTIRPFPHDHHCTTAKWSELVKVNDPGRDDLLCSYGRRIPVSSLHAHAATNGMGIPGVGAALPRPV